MSAEQLLKAAVDQDSGAFLAHHEQDARDYSHANSVTLERARADLWGRGLDINRPVSDANPGRYTVWRSMGMSDHGLEAGKSAGGWLAKLEALVERERIRQPALSQPQAFAKVLMTAQGAEAYRTYNRERQRAERA